MKSLTINLILYIIKFYQICISPYFGPKCRFHPTCSNYAYQAIKIHKFKGLALSFFRIMRCNPIGGFGYDPVPSTTLPKQ